MKNIKSIKSESKYMFFGLAPKCRSSKDATFGNYKKIVLYFNIHLVPIV